MAIFNKRKKNTDAEKIGMDELLSSVMDDEEIEELTEEKKEKKRGRKGRFSRPGKKASDLSSVISESVVESIVALVKENENFQADDGRYALLFFDTDNVGGLLDKSDEEKGQVVAQIQADHIQVIATEDMLKENNLLLVPTERTLEVMGEYEILYGDDANLMWALMDTDTHDVDIFGDASFDDIMAVANGHMYVDDAIGGEGGDDDETPDEDDIDDIDNIDDELDDEDLEEPDFDEEAPDFGDSFVEDESAAFDEPEYEDEPEEIEPPVAQPSPVSEEADAVDALRNEEYEELELADEDPEEVYEEPGEDVVIDEDEIEEIIQNRYFSGDLGIEVDMSEFDKIFSNIDVPFGFDVPEGDTWLNNELRSIITTANSDLYSRRQQAIATLSQRYRSLMGQVASTTMASLDPNIPTTKSGKQFADAQERRDEMLRNVEARKAQKRTELEEAYEADRERHAESARSTAARQYDERFSSKHRREISDAENQIEQSADLQYQMDKARIDDQRREEAVLYMEHGLSETTSILVDEFQNYLAEENEIREKWYAQITDVLESNRSNDIVHTNTLAEELRQTDKAAKVAEDYEAQLNALRTQAQEDAESAMRKLKETQEEAAREAEKAQRHFTEEIEQQRARIKDAESQNDRLRASLTEISDAAERRYEHQISQLKANVDSLNAENQRLQDKASERDNGSLMRAGILGVSGVLAGLAFGAVIAMGMGSNSEPAAQQPQTIVVTPEGSSNQQQVQPYQVPPAPQPEENTPAPAPEQNQEQPEENSGN